MSSRLHPEETAVLVEPDTKASRCAARPTLVHAMDIMCLVLPLLSSHLIPPPPSSTSSSLLTPHPPPRRSRRRRRGPLPPSSATYPTSTSSPRRPSEASNADFMLIKIVARICLTLIRRWGRLLHPLNHLHLLHHLHSHPLTT